MLSSYHKGPLLFIWLLNYAYFMLHQTLNELKVYNIKSLGSPRVREANRFHKGVGLHQHTGKHPRQSDLFNGSGKWWWILLSFHAGTGGDFWAWCSLTVEQSALVLDFGESKEFQKHQVPTRVERDVKREERTWLSRFQMLRSVWPSSLASACCTLLSSSFSFWCHSRGASWMEWTTNKVLWD